MTTDKTRIVLTPWACRQIDKIAAQQANWYPRTKSGVDGPNAWHAGRPRADQAFDTRNNCITVRDYRVIG